MDAKSFMDKIHDLNIWTRRDERAPHKPLLLLYSLARFQNDKIRFLSYEEVRLKMIELLKEFGPRRHSYHPEQPFVRLTNDSIWVLNKEVERSNINNKYLVDNEIVGGFTDEVLHLLEQNPKLIAEAAETLLHKHFPLTLHEDILMALGLDVEIKMNRTRDPKFRNRILRAYEYSCAVCGFNVRLGSNLVAVEAAHIKWFQQGGPDIEENGIALCSLHHKLFDKGVFTLTENRELVVAEDAHGTNGFEEWLMKYHGYPIRNPINPTYRPDDNFINWHIREVFKGPSRYQVQ